MKELPKAISPNPSIGEVQTLLEDVYLYKKYFILHYFYLTTNNSKKEAFLQTNTQYLS